MMTLSDLSSCILIQISPSFVLKGLVNKKPLFVQAMVWGQTGNKPLSEPINPVAYFIDAYMPHSASKSFIFIIDRTSNCHFEGSRYSM